MNFTCDTNNSLNISSSINNPIISNPNINNATISGKNTISDVTFIGSVLGITSSNVGLDKADNTSDMNKPVSISTQTELNTKLPIHNPKFTGLCLGPDIETDNITIKGMATINSLLFDFNKVNTTNNYILSTMFTNVSICGTEADTILLPSDPKDGMTIRISNLSENDILITSNKPMYNMLLAPNGLPEIPLQKKFMYAFTYTENLTKEGHWYFSF